MGPETETRRAVDELPPLRGFGERLAFAVLRTCAGAALLLGLSMSVAALPLLALAHGSPRLHGVGWAIGRIAAAFAVGGALAGHLSRSRKPLLANERTLAASVVASSGGPLLLAAALLLAALAAFHESAPLRALWGDMLAVLRDNRVLEGALEASQMSGFVLAPVAAILVVPTLQMLTSYVFIGSAAVLVLLLLPPSSRFPRGYLVCMLLQASLVFASVCGGHLATGMTTWLAEESVRIAGSASAPETARVLEAIERYKAVLATTSASLTWAFAGYCVWSVPLIASRWARRTFAVPVTASAPSPVSRAVIDLPPRERRRFYEQAAKTLHAASASAGVTIVSLLVAAALALSGILAIR